MKITIELADKDSGTEVIGVHEGLPPGLRDSDNEVGWRMALEKLASFVTTRGEPFRVSKPITVARQTSR